MINLGDSELPPKQECTGTVFRAYSSMFIGNDGRVELKQGFSPLKRKCCKCEKCQYILDELNEMVRCDAVVFPENYIENGDLYTVQVVSSTDWESGIKEVDYFEFVKI